MIRSIQKHKLTVGIILSVFFMFLALRKVSLDSIGVVFAETSAYTIVWMVLINLTARVVIVFRWKFLLSFNKDFTFREAFHYMNIGYLMNSLLPARSGDFIKAVLLAKKVKTPVTPVLGSVAIERLLDLVGLGMTFLVALMVLKLPAYIKEGGVILSLITAAVTLIIIIAARFRKELFDKLAKFSGSGNYQLIIQKFFLIVNYMNSLQGLKLLASLFFSTAISWFLYIYAGYVILEDIAPGPFSWQVSILALLFISVSFVLPTTPGNLGVYQYACVLAFSVTQMPEAQAIVFSLISQIPVYLLNILLGLMSMSHEGLKNKKVAAIGKNQEITKEFNENN